jgi:hypothetical protein
LGGKEEGRGKGGEMTQTIYAHMNKIKIKKKKYLMESQRLFFNIKIMVDSRIQLV